MNGDLEENAVLDLNHPPPPVGLGNLVDDNLNINLTLNLQLRAPSATEFESDDEVVICSPLSFQVARESSRRNSEARSNHEVIEVVDDDNDLQRGHSESTVRSFPGHRNLRKRTRPACFIANNDSGANLESNETNQGKNVAEDSKLSQSVSPSEEPTFSCPICMDPFVESTATKCGHIFCKECIRTAIKVHQKCPTCRRKLKVKDTNKIYLPKCD